MSICLLYGFEEVAAAPSIPPWRMPQPPIEPPPSSLLTSLHGVAPSIIQEAPQTPPWDEQQQEEVKREQQEQDELVQAVLHHQEVPWDARR